MTRRGLLLMLLLSLALMSRSDGASVALLGFVVAADSHQPLEGAHVLVEAGGQQQTSVTDARGAFVFDRVKAGAVTLVVRHPGFGEQRRQVEVRSPGPTSVVVSMQASTVSPAGADVFVAVVTPAAPVNPPPDTVLHFLAALAHNWDPIQSGLKLQQQSGTPVTAWPNALMRLAGGTTDHVEYWRLPTSVYWLAATSDGRHLLAATDSSSIEVLTLGNAPVVERVLPLQPPSIVTSVHTGRGGAYATAVNASGSSAVVAIEPNGERVRATWPLASKAPMSATDLAVSPDGRRLYVTAFGKRGMRGPGPARVYVLDASSGAVIGTVDTPAEPIGAALSPDGRYLLVTSLSAAAVTIIDTTALQAVKRIQVGLRPTRVAVTADGRSAYVSCSGDDKVYVIDLASQRVRTSIDVDKNPLAVHISGGRVIVGCTASRTVCVIEGGRVVSRTSPQASAAPFGICGRP